MTTYTIRPLHLIDMENEMSNFTYRLNFGVKIDLPVFCWYIEGADQRILVDTGADAEMSARIRGLPAKTIKSFEEALAELDLEPADIDIVIQTHLHWDHCGHTSKCRNAKVIVSMEEWLFALAPHPIMAPTYAQDLLDGIDFRPVSGACEVIPGIEVIPAPGHTPGTQAVAVRTSAGKAVITGFCCLRENFEPPADMRPFMPVVTPGIHLNAVDAFESALRVKGMADILIPNHDLALVGVQRVPEA